MSKLQKLTLKRNSSINTIIFYKQSLTILLNTGMFTPIELVTIRESIKHLNKVLKNKTKEWEVITRSKSYINTLLNK